MGLYDRHKKKNWKPLGRKDADDLRVILQDALRSARMEDANFDDVGGVKKETEYIKEKTRLYRQSWIISPIERVLDRLIKQYDL